MVRQFGEREIRPVLDAYEEKEEFPVELYKKMADLGFCGISIPEEHGGIDLDYWGYAAFLEEMGRYGSMRATLTAQQSLVASPILNFGSNAQKERYLPRLAGGEIMGAYGLTEPSAGSDTDSIQTRATVIKRGLKPFCRQRQKQDLSL